MRKLRKRDSLAAATSAPNTAPTASAASVSATVINAASSSTPPQPSGPKPSIPIRVMRAPPSSTCTAGVAYCGADATANDAVAIVTSTRHVNASHQGVTSVLNHLSASFFTVPSASAAPI